MSSVFNAITEICKNRDGEVDVITPYVAYGLYKTEKKKWLSKAMLKNATGLQIQQSINDFMTQHGQSQDLEAYVTRAIKIIQNYNTKMVDINIKQNRTKIISELLEIEICVTKELVESKSLLFEKLLNDKLLNLDSSISQTKQELTQSVKKETSLWKSILASLIATIAWIMLGAVIYFMKEWEWKSDDEKSKTVHELQKSLDNKTEVVK